MDFNTAALSKTIDVPASRRRKTCLVQQRRVQQVRNGACFRYASIQYLHRFGEKRTSVISLQIIPSEDIQNQFKANVILTQRVVKFACNPPLLIISYFKQPARQLVQRFFQFLLCSCIYENGTNLLHVTQAVFNREIVSDPMNCFYSVWQVSRELQV